MEQRPCLILEGLRQADQSYWADRTEEQMLAISAWVAVKEGERDQGVRFMRAAADGEDGSLKNVIMENRLYPLREMLAELLLEVGDLRLQRLVARRQCCHRDRSQRRWGRR